ncbi:hypothetical protein Ait01nite_051930 [Actinoplanes italicus]|nr:hypothetical protein Ait01nite_051930 [Actinoplanes italicus]
MPESSLDFGTLRDSPSVSGAKRSHVVTEAYAFKWIAAIVTNIDRPELTARGIPC